MTTQRTTRKKRDGGSSAKGGLVQFRADELIMADLTHVAERLHVPIGVLARLWVSERLHQELSFDMEAIEAWEKERDKAIDRIVEQEFLAGPIQVLHLVPFQQFLDIEPDRVRQYQGMLPPIERVDEFVGRINLYGYQTIKQYRTADKLSGSVQIFRTGQLESIRELRTDEQNCIYADYVDDDLIRAIWSYCCALEALQVKLPLALFASFKRIRGCRLKSQRFASPSAEITYGEFRMPEIAIRDWDDVLTIENTAQTVKRILDQFANSAGLPRSMSYSARGDWLGPIDRPESHVRRTKMFAKTDIIELPGINREANRVDLVLHDDAEDLVVGKVRAPYLEPTAQTCFKCLVNQDEMSPSAKQRLEYKQQMKLPATFSVGKIRFSGRITKVVVNPGAGSFDGIKIPQEWVLMFEVEPMLRAAPPNRCASCLKPLTNSADEINTTSLKQICHACSTSRLPAPLRDAKSDPFEDDDMKRITGKP